MVNKQLGKLERIICEAAQVNGEELRGPSREKEIVDARHVIWFIARECIGYSYQQLAALYNRDRTSVMHGINRMKKNQSQSELLQKISEKYPEVVLPDPTLAKRGIETWVI